MTARERTPSLLTITTLVKTNLFYKRRPGPLNLFWPVLALLTAAFKIHSTLFVRLNPSILLATSLAILFYFSGLCFDIFVLPLTAVSEFHVLTVDIVEGSVAPKSSPSLLKEPYSTHTPQNRTLLIQILLFVLRAATKPKNNHFYPIRKASLRVQHLTLSLTECELTRQLKEFMDCINISYQLMYNDDAGCNQC